MKWCATLLGASKLQVHVWEVDWNWRWHAIIALEWRLTGACSHFLRFGLDYSQVLVGHRDFQELYLCLWHLI